MKFCSSCKRAYKKNKPTNKITRKKHFCKGGAKFSFQRKVALNLKKAEVVFKKGYFHYKSIYKCYNSNLAFQNCVLLSLKILIAFINSCF